MLRLVNVNSYYGLVHVLKNISIHINEGEIVAILGANGAGKTTTLTGHQRPSTGQRTEKYFIRIRKLPAQTPEKLVGLGIAHVPEGRQIFRPMSVYENLELGGHIIYKLYGKKQLKSDIDGMFSLVSDIKGKTRPVCGNVKRRRTADALHRHGLDDPAEIAAAG